MRTGSTISAVVMFTTALLWGAVPFGAKTVFAASCCGGGSSSSLVAPKFSDSMFDVSLDIEKYDGYWNDKGKRIQDPPGSDLNQYRLNLGYAKRLADNWQASVIVPYVWNDNKYSAVKSETHGIGDSSINLWYEAFDTIMCVWDVKTMKDLYPAAYFGLSLTAPTGTSAYDDVHSSFDVTGRGFYRLDGNMLLEKTIYPWTATFLYSYGVYFERPVNREYGEYVQPYHKKLGDRRLWTLSGGYTHFLNAGGALTGTLAYSDLAEGEGTLNGVDDPITGMKKRSLAATMAWASNDRSLVLKFTYSHPLRENDWGRNFPITDIYTFGVSHVVF